MSQLKVNELTHINNNGEPNIQMFADGSTSIQNLIDDKVVDNKIMNGAFRIRQRPYNTGTGADSAFAATATRFIQDRWRYYNSAAAPTSGTFLINTIFNSPTGGTEDLPDTIPSALEMTCSTPFGDTANNAAYILLGQCIEGYNCYGTGWGTDGGQPITISFWVKSSKTGKYVVTVRNQNGVPTPTMCSYAATYTISAADTWEYITITIPAPPADDYPWNYTSSLGIEVLWCLASGSTYQGTTDEWVGEPLFGGTDTVNDWGTTVGDTFCLTGCQLNVGPTAAKYVLPDVETEIVQCLRYYWASSTTTYLWSGYAAAGSISYQRCNYLVPMRTTPTDEGSGIGATPSPGYNTSTFAFASNASSAQGCTVSLTHTGAANATAFWYAQMIVSAEI
jgi:hypothetical protein